VQSTLTVKEDPSSKELYIELPDTLLEELGWRVGDNIEWIDNKDNSWTLKRA